VFGRPLQFAIASWVSFAACGARSELVDRDASESATLDGTDARPDAPRELVDVVSVRDLVPSFDGCDGTGTLPCTLVGAWDTMQLSRTSVLTLTADGRYSNGGDQGTYTLGCDFVTFRRNMALRCTPVDAATWRITWSVGCTSFEAVLRDDSCRADGGGGERFSGRRR